MSALTATIVIRIAFLLVCGIGSAVLGMLNLPQEERHLMAPLPIAFIALMGVGLALSNPWSQFVQGLEASYALGYNALLYSLLAGPVFDALFFAACALAKLVWGRIAMKNPQGVTNWFSGIIERFYVLDEKKDKRWYLRAECKGLRSAVSTIAFIAFLLTALLCVLAGGVKGVHPCLLPVALVEFASFLNGSAKEKDKDDEFDYQDGGGESVFDYGTLEKAYRHFFGDRLLAATNRGPRKRLSRGNSDVCTMLMESSDPDDQICGAYFDALLRSGTVADGSVSKEGYALSHDRMMDTARLMRGQSVLFATPFYRDYTPYLFLPINSTLLRGRHVLFLVGSHGAKEDVPAFVDEGMAFVTNIPNMWELATLEHDGSAQPDIGIVSFSELDSVDLLINNAEYLARVGMCVITDPSSLLATYQLGLTMLAEHMSRDQQPTFCVFDRNADGLVDSLSHALRTNIVEVGATDVVDGYSFGLFWQVDGEQLQNRLMPGVARYLGVGTELSLVALHEQVERVTWAGTVSPLMDIRWIDSQYYREMFEFADLPQEQSEVDAHFEFSENPTAMARREKLCLVAEDEYHNMFETYRQFSTRGIQESFVNVLVPNYLLRSYMAANRELFSADPKAVPAFAPDVAKSPRNTVYALVMTMLQTGDRISEDEVARHLRYAGMRFGDCAEALSSSMALFFPSFGEEYPESHLVCEERETYVERLSRMETKRYFGLSKEALESRLFSGLRNLELVTELPDGTRKVLGSRLYDLLYQTWLPGQFLTFDGKYYEVVSTSLEGGMLLRRAADHYMSRRYYRQLRTYELSAPEGGPILRSVKEVGGVRVSCQTANIRVRTEGYLDMDDYADVAGARRVMCENVPERMHVSKDYLRIALIDAQEDVVLTVAAVISELLTTLFPYDYQYLSVLCRGTEAVHDGIFDHLVGDCATNEILIVEDSSIDIGLVSAIERNIQRILEMCYEFLDWHEQTLEKERYSQDSGAGTFSFESDEDSSDEGDEGDEPEMGDADVS